MIFDLLRIINSIHSHCSMSKDPAYPAFSWESLKKIQLYTRKMFRCIAQRCASQMSPNLAHSRYYSIRAESSYLYIFHDFFASPLLVAKMDNLGWPWVRMNCLDYFAARTSLGVLQILFYAWVHWFWWSFLISSLAVRCSLWPQTLPTHIKLFGVLCSFLICILSSLLLCHCSYHGVVFGSFFELFSDGTQNNIVGWEPYMHFLHVWSKLSSRDLHCSHIRLRSVQIQL